jgi:hypothetical protein
VPQPFFHEDARIELFREEEYDRVVRRPGVCAVASATGFQAEHVNPAGIPALFSGFGKVMEIDPTCLAGHDMSSVTIVLLMYHTRDAPCDVGPAGGPWGARTATVTLGRTWPSSESFNDAGVYQPFFPPPPPPPFMHNRGPPSFLGVPLSRRLGAGSSGDGGRSGQAPHGGRQLGLMLRLLGPPRTQLMGATLLRRPPLPPRLRSPTVCPASPSQRYRTTASRLRLWLSR